MFALTLRSLLASAYTANLDDYFWESLMNGTPLLRLFKSGSAQRSSLLDDFCSETYHGRQLVPEEVQQSLRLIRATFSLVPGLPSSPASPSNRSSDEKERSG